MHEHADDFSNFVTLYHNIILMYSIGTTATS